MDSPLADSNLAERPILVDRPWERRRVEGRIREAGFPNLVVAVVVERARHPAFLVGLQEEAWVRLRRVACLEPREHSLLVAEASVLRASVFVQAVGVEDFVRLALHCFERLVD
jgi:hypothetical protein